MDPLKIQVQDLRLRRDDPKRWLLTLDRATTGGSVTVLSDEERRALIRSLGGLVR